MSEVEIPQYPPLNSCILIDSRMGSRIELKSYINSTHLFENLIEPESLNAGFKMVTENEIDSCIFGPSVQSEKVKSFLYDLKVSDYKSDCAFLSTYRDGEKQEIEGIHAQVVFPCTRQVFNTSILLALQNANGGELPVSKRKNPITGEPIFIKDAIAKLDLGEGKSLYSYSPSQLPIQDKIQASTSDKASIETFSKQASELAKALADIEPHNLMFRPNGTPSGVTTETIQTLVQKLFPNHERQKGVVDFKLTLEQLLYIWIQNATQYGRKVANAKLREGILSFFSSQT